MIKILLICELICLSGCSTVKTLDPLQTEQGDSNEDTDLKDDLIDDTGGDDNDDEDISDDELDQALGPSIDFAKLDPLERMNRVLYGLHRGIDLMFVRPLALTYTKATPKPIRKGIFNFIRNLTAPLRALCWLLQGNIQEMGKTIGKFSTNTLFGLGGVFNVAAKWGLTETATGFGDTFKKWGIKPGPYIVVPGVGPATFRTAFGMLFDSFVDPMFLLSLNKGLPYNRYHKLTWYDTAAQISGLLMTRGEIDPVYEEVEKNSVSRYSKLRNLVLQQSVNK